MAYFPQIIKCSRRKVKTTCWKHHIEMSHCGKQQHIYHKIILQSKMFHDSLCKSSSKTLIFFCGLWLFEVFLFSPIWYWKWDMLKINLDANFWMFYNYSCIYVIIANDSCFQRYAMWNVHSVCFYSLPENVHILLLNNVAYWAVCCYSPMMLRDSSMIIYGSDLLSHIVQHEWKFIPCSVKH